MIWIPLIKTLLTLNDFSWYLGKLIYSGCITIVHFDILKSVLTPANKSRYSFYRMGWVNPESERTTKIKFRCGWDSNLKPLDRQLSMVPLSYHRIVHLDILKSVLISAHPYASNVQWFFVISMKINVWRLYRHTTFRHSKGELNSAHRDTSNGKGLFFISWTINIWQLHKNITLRHSETWSEFYSSRRFQR